MSDGRGRDLALDEDYHVHSTFSDGESSIAQNVRAARERGLRTLCLVDHVRRDTASALDATDRRCVVAHLFSMLPKLGLDEAVVPESLLAQLAKEVVRAGAMVEVNEKRACPSARTVAAMTRAGVPVVAGTDSHHCRDVGVYRSVRATAAAGIYV